MEQEAQSATGLNLLDLPVETLKLIVSFVRSEDQRSRVRLVSRLFFDVVELSHFSLGLILPAEMEQLAQIFGRYTRPIGLTLNKTDMLAAKNMNHLSSLTQLTSLRARNAYMDGSTLLHLTNLVSLESEYGSDATSYIAQLTKLETLDFINGADIWSNFTNNRVTSLTLKSKTSPPHGWLEHFKHLRVLNMACTARLNTADCRFPVDLCNNLTSLSLTRIFVENKTDIPWHQLKALSLDFPSKSIDVALLHTIATCTSLTSLNINHVNHQSLVDAINVHELKQLQSFTLLIGGAAPFGSVRNVLTQLNKETLATLQTPVWDDHQECITEISKMAKLESLHLYVRYPTLDHEPCDMSALMTMNHLTSLSINTSKCKGLEHIVNMTNLQSLRIISDMQDYPLETLCLSSFSNLKCLEISGAVKSLDIRGITGLQSLYFQAPKTESELKFVVEEMQSLKEISIGDLLTPPLWIDLARCTALESITSDSFDSSGDSVLALQNLQHLTSLGNSDAISPSQCAHFSVDHLTCLTRLQHIEVRVPELNVRDTLLKKLPMAVHVRERLCIKCRVSTFAHIPGPFSFMQPPTI